MSGRAPVGRGLTYMTVMHYTARSPVAARFARAMITVMTMHRVVLEQDFLYAPCID